MAAADVRAAEADTDLPPLCVCGQRHDAWDSVEEESDEEEDEEGLPPLCSCGQRHSDEEMEEETVELPPLCACGMCHDREDEEAEDATNLPPRCICGVRHGYDDEDGEPHVHLGGGDVDGDDGFGFVPWNHELGLSPEDVLQAVSSSLGATAGSLGGGGRGGGSGGGGSSDGGVPAFVVPPNFPFGPVMLDGTGMAAFLRGDVDDAEPPPRPGLSPAAIERLAPAQAWPPPSAPSAPPPVAGAGASPAAAPDANFADEDCAVCQEGLSGAAPVRSFPCKHVFHAACADRWLAGSVFCPCCRRDFSVPRAGAAGGGAAGGRGGRGRGGNSE